MLSLLTNDPVLIALDQLRMDGGTQSRAGTDAEVVVEYRHIYQDGGVEAMPPVHAIHDGINYWLWDGFHRAKAASGLLDALYVIVEPGTQEDARWRSYSANRTHGLRRTSADKARAVQAALRHPNAQSMSDRALGDHLGVDGKTVARYRREMEMTAEIPQSVTRTGRDGRTINTEQIGQTAQAPTPKHTPKPAPKPAPVPAPKPIGEYEWQNERALNYEMLIGVFRSALDAIPEFEQLTGIFTHSPAARRAMEQLIADLTEQKESLE